MLAPPKGPDSANSLPSGVRSFQFFFRPGKCVNCVAFVMSMRSTGQRNMSIKWDFIDMFERPVDETQREDARSSRPPIASNIYSCRGDTAANLLPSLGSEKMK